jgi:type I restriction enzyme S subunit
VIVSTVRTYLKAIAEVRNPPENLVVSTGFAVLRPKPGLSPRFLAYLVKSDEFCAEVESRSVGVSYPAIGPHEVSRIYVPVPPERIQNRIADFLDRETAEIDALIEKQERLIALLEEKRQAFISHAVTKGLDPTVPMKDSGIPWLGEIPSHWTLTSIKRVVAIPVTDGPHETPMFYDSGIPFVSAEAVSQGFIDFERIRGYISVEDHKRYSKKYLPLRGDIFIIKSGATTGISAIVETDAEFNIWSPLAVVRCSQALNAQFALSFVRSRNFQEAIALGWSFGTQQNIGMGVIENLAIVVPPEDEQHLIIGQIRLQGDHIDEVIRRSRRGIALLRERRAAIISAAVTGKIVVTGRV